MGGRSVCDVEDSVVSGWSVKQTFTTSTGTSLKQDAANKIVSRNFLGEVYPNPVFTIRYRIIFFN
jgi:hypothetical protein